MHDATHHHHPDGTPFPAADCAGLQVLTQGKAAVDLEDVFIRKDGTFFDVIYSSAPLTFDNEITGLVVVFRDVTERKKNEAALLRSQEELRSANEDLKHFSYAASHDLQEPLRMVMSYTQLLAREHKDGLGPNADKYIAHAVEGAERMEALLTDLREYWSVNEQKVENLVPVDCNRVLEKALTYLEMRVRESGAVITHDSLPTVMAEEVPLTLLLQNLIGNAIKYRRPNEPARISISAGKKDSAWNFAVTDNGIGVGAEYLQMIFAPFKRLHGREYPGTGIGLAMCQKIVERYQGRIWAE